MELKNRQIHNFEIKETFTAGLCLVGLEVKNISKGDADISGSRCIFKDVPLLVGMYIKKTESVFAAPYEANRDRQLLLKKNQVRYIKEQIKKGYSVIPIRLFFKKYYKLEVAICRPIKKWDHREKDKLKQENKENEIS